MRFVVVTGLFASAVGCAEPCETVTELTVAEPVRHGLFIEVDGAQLETASNRAGHVVRATCDEGVRMLDPTLRSDGSADVSYDYDDARSVSALAIDENGTFAVITFELDYIGDIDEKSVTRLTVFEPNGSRRWSQVLAQDGISSDYSGLAIGADQVFVGTKFGRLEAFAKDSGAPAWSKTIMGARDLGIAADPAGGVTVTSDAQVSSYSSTGSVRWYVPATMIGLVDLDRVAQAADGSIAVLGSDGNLQLMSAQKIVMLEPNGALRWSQPLGTRFADRVTSMVTDGVHIVVGGDYGGRLGFDPSAPDSDDSAGFLSTVGATGVVSTFTVSGEGTQRIYVTSMTADSAFIRATSFDTETVPRLQLPGVAVEGNGVAILEVAR